MKAVTAMMMFFAATAVVVASTHTPSALRSASVLQGDESTAASTAMDMMQQILSRLDALQAENEQLKITMKDLKQRMELLEDDNQYQRHLASSCAFKSDDNGVCVLSDAVSFTGGVSIDGDAETVAFDVNVPMATYSDVTIEGPSTVYPVVVVPPEGSVEVESGEPVTPYYEEPVVDQPTSSFTIKNHVDFNVETKELIKVFSTTIFQKDVMIQIVTEDLGLKLEQRVEEVVEEDDKKKSKKVNDRHRERHLLGRSKEQKRNLGHKKEEEAAQLAALEQARLEASIMAQPDLYVGGFIKVNGKVEIMNGKLILDNGDIEVLDGDAKIDGQLEVDFLTVKGAEDSDAIVVVEGDVNVKDGGAIFEGLVEAKGDIESPEFIVV